MSRLGDGCGSIRHMALTLRLLLVLLDVLRGEMDPRAYLAFELYTLHDLPGGKVASTPGSAGTASTERTSGERLGGRERLGAPKTMPRKRLTGRALSGMFNSGPMGAAAMRGRTSPGHRGWVWSRYAGARPAELPPQAGLGSTRAQKREGSHGLGARSLSHVSSSHSPALCRPQRSR